MFNSFGIKNGAAQLAWGAAAVGTMAFVALTAAGGASLAWAQTGPSNTRTHTHTHTHAQAHTNTHTAASAKPSLQASTASSMPPEAPLGWAPDARAGFYRQPALTPDAVVFVAEGDLWKVSRQGGVAQRLTTHLGAEGLPAVSPDGRWLAFTGQYDGASEVYVMPAAGGVPQRLSWEGGSARVWGFTAQGEVLYTAVDGRPASLLFAVNPRTLERRQLPVAQASDGALSTDGRTLIFTRGGLRGDNARQYRGGGIARLWTMDLSRETEARALLPEGNNDRRPMPYAVQTATGQQERIAFLSDRDGTVNLWSVDAHGQDLRQHTQNRGWDIRHASLWGSSVVYALGADLYTVDLADANSLPSARSEKLAITLQSDFDQQRQRWVKRPQDFLTDVALAPNGERVVLASRGRLATQGVGALRRAELPQAPYSRCRHAVFSANSQQVFAVCDFSGEPEIWRFAANGLSQPEPITQGMPDALNGQATQRGPIVPSPDGRYLVHSDKEGRIYLTDLQSPSQAQSQSQSQSQAKGQAKVQPSPPVKPNAAAGSPPSTLASALPTTRRIAQSRLESEGLTFAWSADSRALAWAMPLRHADRSQVVIYSLATQTQQWLTSDRYASESPAFSPDGRWLYFISNRHLSASGFTAPWGDRNFGPSFDRRGRIYALALQGGLRLPFAAPDELQPTEAGDSKTSDAKPSDARPTEAKSPASVSSADATKPSTGQPPGKAEPAAKSALPAIVFDGLRERLFEVPVPPGNYSELRVAGKRLWVLDADASRTNSLKTLPIDNQGSALETVSGEVRSYALSTDGKKLMLVRGAGTPEVLLVDAAPKLPGDLAKFQVRWSDWSISTQPQAEWRQMFADAWRLHRDHFYDKAMHGVDWAAMRVKYEALLPRVTDRAELAELMAQMVSELGALHSQVNPGEVRTAPDDPGLAGLGARMSRVAQGWRIDHILLADPELPGEAPPLAAPGLGLKVGDVITAINGRSAAEAPHWAELLRGQAGKQVLLELRTADGKTLQRIVTPVAQRRETQLRYNDWRFGRAQAVDRASQGRIGYVHLRAMGADDIADFAREFYAQTDREGLILDVRHNNGGNIDSWVLEKLLRRAWAFWQARSPEGSPTYSNMQQAFRGHVVLLMNEDTYSDGETLAEGFKRLGLGLTFGKTTSGAGVWLSDGNRLLDNGMMRAAENGQLSAQRQFLIEGVGVKPDVEIDNPPRATFQGRDAQLEAAIAHLQKRIKEQPVTPVVPGPYPRPVRP